MTLNELAISTFESDYLKNYLNSMNYKFSLDEIVTIILNSNMTMSTKMSTINRVLDPLESREYTCSNKERLTDDIALMRLDYNYIMNCCFGAYNSIITFFDECDNTQCFTSLGAAHKKLKTLGLSLGTNIIIMDGNDSSEVAYIDSDENGDMISYTLCKPVNGRISELYDKYIDIPNDIKIGDTIKLCGNDIEYIVVADSKIPDKLKDRSEYSIDACITAVPKSVLDPSKDYKKQVEDILEHRIKNVDNEHEELDIISKEHEHFHLSIVEKVEDNKE